MKEQQPPGPTGPQSGRDGELSEDRFLGRTDLTRWRAPLGRWLAGVVHWLSARLGPHAALFLTLAVGAAIAAALTYVSAEVYEAVTEADGVAALDHPLLEAAKSVRSPWLDTAATGYTDIAGTIGMPILAATIMVVLAIKRRSWTPVILMLTAAAGSLLMTVVGKHLFGRGRPSLADAIPPYEHSPSFPSGHTLNATVIAGVVAYLIILRLDSLRSRILTILAAGLFAFTVGLSRIYLGHHWFTDVLVAWTLGAVWLVLVITAHRLYLTANRQASVAGPRHRSRDAAAAVVPDSRPGLGLGLSSAPHSPKPKDAMAENQPRQGKRAAVVINPVKSPDEHFKATFTQLCTDAGWDEPLWLETSKDDPGHGQAREALKAGVDVVIAAGGDGTIRAVAEVLAGTDIAMGLLPLGTGNLLARNLGIDVADPVRAVQGVLEGTETKIDVIMAVVDHAEQEHMFLVAAGLGYDAAIMANTVDGLKDRMGWLAYVESGIRNLPGKPVSATITVDGKQETHRKVRGVMVGNCGKLMGGIEIFQGAVPTDGVLDLLTFSPRGKFGWLGVVVGVFGKGKSRSVRSLSGKTAEIALDSPQDFQIDGDHMGSASHLLVTVDPRALTIRMTAPALRDGLKEAAKANKNAQAHADAA